MSNDWRSIGFVSIKMFCAVVMLISTMFIFYTVGPSLETRMWPVVAKLQILSVRATTDGRTEIRAAFRKLRECEYLGIAWYVGDRPNEFERVSVVLQRDPTDTASPNRPLGYQKAGPWIIGVQPADLKARSFAQLYHRCHPFWNTTTEFYP